MTNNDIDVLYKKIREKALDDLKFRKCLLEDPRKCIAKYFMIQIPDNFTFKVIESDPAYNATFVIPPLKESLSDTDLDTVAGGVNICSAYAGIQHLNTDYMLPGKDPVKVK